MIKKKVSLIYIIISALVVVILTIVLIYNQSKTASLNKKFKKQNLVIKNLKKRLEIAENRNLQYKNILNSDNRRISKSDSVITDYSNDKSINCRTLNYRNQEFYSFAVDLLKSNLTFNSLSKSGKRIKTINSLKNELIKQKKNLIFATNGGMFKPDYSPVGLYVENEKELSPINLQNGKGNFFLKPNGIFYISKWNKAGIIESSNYDKIKGNIKYATQSGPLLLLNGNVHDKFRENSVNKHIRSGVGIIDTNTVVFIISKKPVNFYDFAMLFKEEFNCKNALYLDGFISEMYLPELELTKSENEFSILINVTKNLE